MTYGGAVVGGAAMNIAIASSTAAAIGLGPFVLVGVGVATIGLGVYLGYKSIKYSKDKMKEPKIRI